MMLALSQGDFRSWCYTIIAIGTALTVLVGWGKLIKQKIATEVTKRAALQSLVLIAPAIVEVAHQFPNLKTDVEGIKRDVAKAMASASEAVKVSERTDEKVDRLLLGGIKNEVDVEKLAQQMRDEHQ